MLEKQSTSNDESIRSDAIPSVGKDGNAVEQPIKSERADPASKQAAPAKHRAGLKRKLVIGVTSVVVLAAVLIYGVPLVQLTLNTVSTDDAYVNGHVTFVAPRVSGQIARVLVDDNNRVRKGDLLAALDKEPFEVVVAEKKAAVDTAQAGVAAATAQARGIEAQARSLTWQLR